MKKTERIGVLGTVNPGLGPVWVKTKTHLGIGPEKPGRPETWVNPGVTRLYFLIYISKTPPLQTF